MSRIGYSLKKSSVHGSARKVQIKIILILIRVKISTFNFHFSFLSDFPFQLSIDKQTINLLIKFVYPKTKDNLEF